ncbi:MAG: hypothetical protein J0H22_10345, partial [Actinobacteria bacterium]|nr:hypothetical protein [Actinomycetota bacterium]
MYGTRFHVRREGRHRARPGGCGRATVRHPGPEENVASDVLVDDIAPEALLGVMPSVGVLVLN